MYKSIKIFKALSTKTRFLIVRLLLTKEMCACKIPNLIKSTQSNTSMQLARLVEDGILKKRRDGKKILYSIKDKEVIKILRIVKNK
jgi:ArsR family transcriptional regulator, lead/cadmium/zinc/bismuth-responsive transcriptional repressor